MNEQGRRRAPALWWIAAVASVFAAKDFLPQFLRDDLYQGDLCQHVWWTYRFADPGLFPNDPIAAFMSRPILAPYGWQTLYRMFAPFVDSQRFAETIPFVLTVLVVVLAFRLGDLIGGLTGGVAAATYISATHALRQLEGGLPRSFALPIVLFGVCSLIARRHAMFGVALLLAALLYPPVMVNLAALGLVVIGYRTFRDRRLPAGWLALAALTLAAMVVMLSAYAGPTPADIGPRVTAEQARAMPEYWPGGRARFFEHDASRFYFTSSRSGLEIRPMNLVVGFIVMVMVGSLLGWGISLEAWALGATSVGCFILAHATLFLLHYPNRYAKYALTVFIMMWLADAVPRVLEAVRSRMAGRGMPVVRYGTVLHAAAWLILVGVAWGATRSIARDLAAPIPAGREEALAFIGSLPRDTLVAAHPLDADMVTLRARRSVLASMETSLPYYAAYYKENAARIESELAATYATDLRDVTALNEKYGVAVFLLNRQRFGKQGWRYFLPFEEANRARFERGRREGFALLQLPAERILFQKGDYAVVRLAAPPGGSR